MMRAWTNMDTGSNLMWVLFHPYHHYYKQKGSIFHPRSSKIYKKVDCHSHHCSLLRRDSCNDHNKCKYENKYFDSSGVSGILSTEAVGLQSAISNEIVYVKNIIIGCTHHTKGPFGKGGIRILGHNRGKLSLMCQLGHHYGRSFSYCSPMIGESSTFYFGSAGKVSGPGVVITDLVDGGIGSAAYELILETITIASAEEQPIIVSPPQAVKQGKNIMIDSRSLHTYIDRDVMNDLLKLLRNKILLPPTSNNNFDLCYNISRGMNEVVPYIKFQFAGPVMVTLTRKNTFIEIGSMFCLSIQSNYRSRGFSILGNHLLINYRIGFDLDANTIAFYEEDCSVSS